MKIFLQKVKNPFKLGRNLSNSHKIAVHFSNFYKQESLKRIHNRLIYDEYDHIRNDEFLQKVKIHFLNNLRT